MLSFWEWCQPWRKQPLVDCPQKPWFPMKLVFQWTQGWFESWVNMTHEYPRFQASYSACVPRLMFGHGHDWLQLLRSSNETAWFWLGNSESIVVRGTVSIALGSYGKGCNWQKSPWVTTRIRVAENQFWIPGCDLLWQWCVNGGTPSNDTKHDLRFNWEATVGQASPLGDHLDELPNCGGLPTTWGMAIWIGCKLLNPRLILGQLDYQTLDSAPCGFEYCSGCLSKLD